MSTIERVKELVAQGKWKVSDHAADEMNEDGILPADLLDGVQSAQVVEDYPTYAKGPSVLVLQSDSRGRPMHVVWGIPAGASEPAVAVTVYLPDPARWSSDFTQRLQ